MDTEMIAPPTIGSPKAAPVMEPATKSETVSNEPGKAEATDTKIAETKPTGEAEQPREGEKKTEEASDPDAKTDGYDLKVPDGMELDAELLKVFSPVAQSLGLTNEQAQQLADAYSSYAMQQSQQQQQAQEKARHDLLNDWKQQSENHAEFGGVKFKENLPGIGRAFHEFTTEQERQWFEETGLGNHPVILGIFHRVYQKALKEDRMIQGGSGAVHQRSLAEKLYPTMAGKHSH